MGCKNASKKVLKIYAFSLSEIATQRIFETLNGKNKRLRMLDKTSYKRNKKIGKKYLLIHGVQIKIIYQLLAIEFEIQR